MELPSSLSEGLCLRDYWNHSELDPCSSQLEADDVESTTVTESSCFSSLANLSTSD